ncbi:MAG: anti-sigma factor family protein [Candidatus Kapaibacteriota bacterium]|jgi:hypothetical protein
MHIHDEHLSAYLDGQLVGAEKAALESRLREDAAFAAEYRSLQSVKQLLQTRATTLRGATPANARHYVMVHLEQESFRTETLNRISYDSKRQERGVIEESALQTPASPQRHHTAPKLRQASTIIGFLQKRPALLAAAVGVMILSALGLRLLLQPSPTSPVQGDKSQQTSASAPMGTIAYESVFVKESLQNYRAVCTGAITLQYKTNSFEKLDEFFHQNGIQYNIVHPRINAELLGGVVSEEFGKKSAHLVFKHGDTLLYMWEIDVDDKTAKHASMRDEIWALLDKGEWLWDTKTGDSATVVFWEDEKQGKRTLCSVVSALPRTNLQPLFQ